VKGIVVSTPVSTSKSVDLVKPLLREYLQSKN
jgi:hypothetical protein